jgi:hypothetical protein
MVLEDQSNFNFGNGSVKIGLPEEILASQGLCPMEVNLVRYLVGQSVNQSINQSIHQLLLLLSSSSSSSLQIAIELSLGDSTDKSQRIYT